MRTLAYLFLAAILPVSTAGADNCCNTGCSTTQVIEIPGQQVCFEIPGQQVIVEQAIPQVVVQQQPAVIQHIPQIITSRVSSGVSVQAPFTSVQVGNRFSSGFSSFVGGGFGNAGVGVFGSDLVVPDVSGNDIRNIRRLGRANRILRRNGFRGL